MSDQGLRHGGSHPGGDVGRIEVRRGVDPVDPQLEPSVDAAPCAEPKQLREAVALATERELGPGDTDPGERKPEAEEVLTQRSRIGLDLTGHHADPLRDRTLGYQMANADRHLSALGVCTVAAKKLEVRQRRREGPPCR